MHSKHDVHASNGHELRSGQQEDSNSMRAWCLTQMCGEG